MIIQLVRESDTALHCEAPGVPSHRVNATPFEAAECEVRRRVLRSLADRETPPTAVVFVRTWESAERREEPSPIEVQVAVEQVESSPRRGRKAKA